MFVQLSLLHHAKSSLTLARFMYSAHFINSNFDASTTKSTTRGQPLGLKHSHSSRLCQWFLELFFFIFFLYCTNICLQLESYIMIHVRHVRPPPTYHLMTVNGARDASASRALGTCFFLLFLLYQQLYIIWIDLRVRPTLPPGCVTTCNNHLDVCFFYILYSHDDDEGHHEAPQASKFFFCYFLLLSFTFFYYFRH